MNHSRLKFMEKHHLIWFKGCLNSYNQRKTTFSLTLGVVCPSFIIVLGLGELLLANYVVVAESHFIVIFDGFSGRSISGTSGFLVRAACVWSQ